MAKTRKSSKSNLRRVKFSFESPDAREVMVLGDFNNWDPAAHPMKSDGNGKWDRTVMIIPGKYEYKFLVDSQWQVDPCNDQRSPNCFGTDNSVLKLK